VLVTLPTPEAQRSVANQIMRMGLSVRQAEAIAKKLREGVVPPSKKKKRLSPEMFSLEAQFREQLGTKVNIQTDGAGENAGKVVIHFYNDEELQAIFEAIVGAKQTS
jgi:ParB family chromosome partitioning protein